MVAKKKMVAKYIIGEKMVAKYILVKKKRIRSKRGPIKLSSGVTGVSLSTWHY